MTKAKNSLIIYKIAIRKRKVIDTANDLLSYFSSSK